MPSLRSAFAPWRIGRAAFALCALVGLARLVAGADATPATAAAAPVYVLRIDGAIGPASADYVHRGIERAERDAAQLVVLQLDTPGGLDTAMRSIIKDILGSRVAVATFVAPQGARAASAGTYILYASHVAAMAPATNLGAATPVAIGMPGPGGGPEQAPPRRDGGGASAPEPAHDAMSAKRVGDAAAYIRGLATLRGRNVQWAERAVREAVSLASSEALAQGVIDLVAADVPELLRKLDGRTLTLQDKRVTLATAAAPIVSYEPDWRGRVLAVLSDPSVALILMMLGMYGLLFEFSNPGFVLPGVVGGVCLLLGLFGLQMLPINYVGLALIVLGIAFFIAEAFMPSFGALGLGGVAAFAFGALMLIDDEVPGFGVPPWLVGALTLASAGVVIGLVGVAAKARRRPVVSGVSMLVGTSGVVVASSGCEGWAEVEGERWQVRAAGELRAGDRVRVVRVDGLVLEVDAMGGESEGA